MRSMRASKVEQEEKAFGHPRRATRVERKEKLYGDSAFGHPRRATRVERKEKACGDSTARGVERSRVFGEHPQTSNLGSFRPVMQLL